MVMAANQNSGIDVFFGAEFNFRVQIPDFRRAQHYNFKKPFSRQPAPNSLFTVSRLDAPLQYVLKACVIRILPLFTCRTRERELALDGSRLAGRFPTSALKVDNYDF